MGYKIKPRLFLTMIVIFPVIDQFKICTLMKLLHSFVLNGCYHIHLSHVFEYLLSSRYGLLAMPVYSTFHSLSSINFLLSSKTWGLRCFLCNVPEHSHLRQIRNVIQANFKVNRVVLCHNS